MSSSLISMYSYSKAEKNLIRFSDKSCLAILIHLLSLFSLVAMAGNIIPAIATTNAIIAGLIVMEALKLLAGNIQGCRTVSTSLPFLSTCLPPIPPSLPGLIVMEALKLLAGNLQGCRTVSTIFVHICL